MVLVQSLDKTLTLKSPLIILRSHLSHTEERQIMRKILDEWLSSKSLEKL